MDTIERLINDYLDDELDDRAFDVLVDSLRKHPARLNDLALNSFLHSLLTDWMSQRRVQDEALLETLIATSLNAGHFNSASGEAEPYQAFDEKVGTATPWQVSRPDPGGRGRSRRRFLAGLFAASLVAAGIAIVTDVIVSQPVIVAQLTQTKGARWQGSQAGLTVGTLLERGQQLHLVEGHALITFVSGAQVLLEGPTTFRLDSAMATHIDDGNVTAKVPTQTIGFTITSPLARFIDLGTEFTLKLNAVESFEIHVFDCIVEVQLDDPSGMGVQPLRIAQSRAVRFATDATKPENIPYDPGQRISL